MKKLSLSTSNNIKQNNSLPFSKRYSTDYTINEDPYESFDYHNDKNNLQSIDQILINDGKSLSCSNKKCIETAEEVEQLTEECNDLEQKCILIDYSRSEELLNLSDKISLISSNVQNLIDSIEIYEGDSLDNLQYENLTKIEINLLNLLIKVKRKISKVNIFKILGRILYNKWLFRE